MSPNKWPGARGSLAETFSGRANSFGLLRLLLAASVVYSHVYPVGYGPLDPLWNASGKQTDVGKMAVIGFFVLSGFMITGSGVRTTIGRYSWHRALRILPGLWGSLLVSVLIILPVMYHWEHGTLTGYFSHSDGPLHYLAGTWNTSISNGWDASGVIAWGVHHKSNHDPGINGALWSLKYEIFCYVVIGLMAAGGVLRRARRFVVLFTGFLWVLMLCEWINAPTARGIPGDMSSVLSVPFLGSMSVHFILYLGFAFMLGASAQLFKERVPINDALALVSAVLLALSLLLGGLTVVGYAAFAYLLLWLAVRLPRPFQKIGRKRDYSYGIYIYGFTVEQALALFGFNKHGHLEYFALAMAGTVVLAAASWHLVESQAMKLKDWTPSVLRRRPDRHSTPHVTEPAPSEPARVQ